jgi:hypothetical protein
MKFWKFCLTQSLSNAVNRFRYSQTSPFLLKRNQCGVYSWTWTVVSASVVVSWMDRGMKSPGQLICGWTATVLSSDWVAAWEIDWQLALPIPFLLSFVEEEPMCPKVWRQPWQWQTGPCIQEFYLHNFCKTWFRRTQWQRWKSTQDISREQK